MTARRPLIVDTGQLKQLQSGDGIDASLIDYVPSDNTKWTSGADPGQTDDALDQLASRTNTLESGAGTGGRYVVTKIADESVTSSTTLQSDNELIVPILASEKWEVDYMLWAEGATAGDIGIGWVIPSGATATIFMPGELVTTATGVSGSFFTNAYAYTNTAQANNIGLAGAGSGVAISFRIVVTNSTTAGNITLTWAQGSSNGTATIVKAGSYLAASRLYPLTPAIGANYGAMQLIQRQVLTAATTSITFSGLDLATDSMYIVKMGLKNATASTPNITQTFNGDTTTTNYYIQSRAMDNASVAANRQNTANVGSIPASSYTVSELHIFKPATGDVTRTWLNRSDSTASAISESSGWQAWTNTANVTSVTYTSSVASALDVGSYIELYRLSPVNPVLATITATAGAMRLVQRQELVAAATTITFSGLDLNTDESYLAVYSLKNATGTGQNISLFYNGDTTVTNYRREDVSGVNLNDAAIAFVDTASNGGCSGEVRIFRPATSERVRNISNYTSGPFTTGMFTNTIGGSWTTVSTNITSITFSHPTASGLAIGSFVSLYALKPTLPSAGTSLTAVVPAWGSTITTSVTASMTSNRFLVDATAGNITITMPTASSYTNYEPHYKRIDATTNTVTFTNDVFNTTYSLASYDTVSMKSNGTLWYPGPTGPPQAASSGATTPTTMQADLTVAAHTQMLFRQRMVVGSRSIIMGIDSSLIGV